MAFSFSLMGSPSLYTDVSTQTHSYQNTMGLASEASPPRIDPCRFPWPLRPFSDTPT